MSFRLLTAAQRFWAWLDRPPVFIHALRGSYLIAAGVMIFDGMWLHEVDPYRFHVGTVVAHAILGFHVAINAWFLCRGPAPEPAANPLPDDRTLNCVFSLPLENLPPDSIEKLANRIIEIDQQCEQLKAAERCSDTRRFDGPGFQGG